MLKTYDSASGHPKVVPKLVAQHHCNPPPSPSAMAAWLRALRKRHSKQIKAMQLELKEKELFIERQEGYKSSAKSDREREKLEAKLEAERKLKEEEEKQRLADLERRREELLQSLPEEPPQGDNDVIIIALRFADGRNAKRRFSGSHAMGYIFNWVDGEFGIERERVLLTTMNGNKIFTYGEFESVSLDDTGLGKMTGLRVSEIKEETDDACDIN